MPIPLTMGNPPTHYVLGESLQDLDDYLQRENDEKIIANDCEATSLDTRRADLVGISLSLEPTTAIYLPIGHKLGKNLPVGPVMERIDKKVRQEGYTTAYYNAKYDLNVEQRNTKWAPDYGKFIDLLELVYMSDPDRHEKGLKLVCKEDLGFDMAKFESLFTPDEVKKKIYDISTKSPQRCVDYACADADGTLRLWPKFKWVMEHDNQEFAVKVDTKLIEVVRRMEHNGGLRLNRSYILEQIGLLSKREEALRGIIHRIVGYDFEINSSKQLGIALFERAGVPNQGMTAGGQYKTDAETMEKLAEQYPLVEFVISYRKVAKAAGTYFAKLLKVESMNIPIRFGFNMFSAPTFRFAAPGGDPEKDGMSGINIQAVSNGESRDVMAVDLQAEKKEDDYLSLAASDEILIDTDVEPMGDDGASAVPWEGILSTLPHVLIRVDKDPVTKIESEQLTCIRETCRGCPADCASKHIDITRRLLKNVRMVPAVRPAFMAPEGFTLVELDYDRQELVIGANMSAEPAWLDALLLHEDLHIKAACGAFNLSEEMYFSLTKDEQKAKRDIGKILNFAIFYGATAWTLAKKANISQAQAEQVYNNFRNTHPVLFSWISKVHAFARKNGYTTTYFGRKRLLDSLYAQADRLLQAGRVKEAAQRKAFADRSAVNTAIQGCLRWDSRVQTLEGTRQIGELFTDGKSVQVWTGFRWARATAVNRGSAMLADVTLENGAVLHCDTRHKLKNHKNEWLDFKDLKSGSLVALPKLPGRVDWDGAKEEWYLAGRITGDGCWMSKGSKGTELQLYYGPTEWVEAERQCRWLWERGINANLTVKKREREEKQDNFVLQKQNSPRLKAILDKIGMEVGFNSHTKRVPEGVWAATLQQKAEFLAGLNQSDGASYNPRRGTEIWIHLCNRELLQDVQKLYYELGTATRLTQTKEGWLLYSRREPRYPVEAMREALRGLALVKTRRGDTVSIVARLIQKGGRKLGCTQSMAEAILARYNPNWEVYRYEKVWCTHVHEREEDTYTMSVYDDLHQFVADGLIQKNTGAEIARIAMVKVDKYFRDSNLTKKEVFLANMVHDSLAFAIRKELVSTITPQIMVNMTSKVKSWTVQLTVAPKVGDVWGRQKEYKTMDKFYEDWPLPAVA